VYCCASTRMIASLKRSSLAFSKRIGLSEIVAESAWRRQRLLILCYHGIALDDEHVWNPHLYVSAAHFRRRLEILRRSECSVLPLADAIERLYGNDLPERAVALTFDDGYFDFMARAWPLLQEHGFPATVYLTTARVEHNFPIFNLFAAYVLWKGRDKELDGRGLPGLSGRYPLATADERRRVVRDVDSAVQSAGLSASDKDRIGQTLAERLALDYPALLASRVLTLMQPAEVGRLAQEGLDVQLHTHMHRTPEDPRLFVEDVRRNGDRIEEMTGRRPTHLCYPSGVFRAAYLPALRREGVVSATTCRPGMATRASEPLLLPRFVDTTSITEVEFDAWVTGIASCLPRRTTRPEQAVH
jgi:peptidoglycan/xylan/chitin deacetylase (PgdA/CDA1 family)